MHSLECENHSDNDTCDDDMCVFLLQQVIGAPLNTNESLTVKCTGKYHCLWDQTGKKAQKQLEKKAPLTEN